MIAKPGQLLLLQDGDLFCPDELGPAVVQRADPQQYAGIAAAGVAEADGPDAVYVVKVLHVVRRSAKVES